MTLHPFTVHHIAHACGLKIRGAQGRDWSVVFSGDTRPCNNVSTRTHTAGAAAHPLKPKALQGTAGPISGKECMTITSCTCFFTWYRSTCT